MSVLLERIRELQRQVTHWRRRAYDLERSRDMWRDRALRRSLR